MSVSFVVLPLVLMSAPPPSDSLTQEVRQAILTAAQQTFHGRIQFHQDALYPPRPDLAEVAEDFDPDDVSEDLPPEAKEKQRRWQAGIQERLLRRAHAPTRTEYDLAVTLGPGGAIRFDRYSPHAPRSTIALRDDYAWEYQSGQPYLTVCDARSLRDPPTIPARALSLEMGEAKQDALQFVNQMMRAEWADAVRFVTSAAASGPVAELEGTDGPITVHFRRAHGGLRVSSVTTTQGGLTHKTAFERYVQAGGAWLPQRVEYTRCPVGASRANRRTIHEVTGITLFERISGDPFARPDPYDPNYAELQYEQDVSFPDNPMMPLREGLEPLPVAREGLAR